MGTGCIIIVFPVAQTREIMCQFLTKLHTTIDINKLSTYRNIKSFSTIGLQPFMKLSAMHTEVNLHSR